MELWKELTGLVSNQGAALLIRFAVAGLIFVVVAFVGRLLAGMATRAIRKRRQDSLGPLIGRVVKWVAVVGAAFMALDHLGVNVATLLAGAGIVGLAVGFGAQSLVKDVISGFFLMFDDILREGDIVTIGEAAGVVEHIGLRVTEIRAFDGTLWHLPNGDIARVGNWSREWMRAIVNVGLAYEQDVGRGMQVIQEVGDQWAAENEEILIEPPEVQGVMGLNASDVGVRLIVKLKAGEHWAAERELRRRIKQAFDEQGVEIPFPRQVTYHRQEPGAALALASDAES